MAIKDTDRKARANYKKKVKTIRVELYGTDEDIKEHLNQLQDDGIPLQGYIKDLIRADIAKKRVETELEKYEAKLREDRRKEVERAARISDDRRAELQKRIDSGEKISDIFKPKK